MKPRVWIVVDSPGYPAIYSRLARRGRVLDSGGHYGETALQLVLAAPIVCLTKPSGAGKPPPRIPAPILVVALARQASFRFGFC